MSRYFFRGIDKSSVYAYILFMEHDQELTPAGARSGGGFPLCFLQRSDARFDPGIIGEEEMRDDVREGRSRLLCKTCGAPVTSEAECIAVNGSHDHICRNPGGLVFHVGCFAGAVGCISVGVFTEEFTWFPGYAWCCVICSGCQSHLGWRYEAGGEGFFGLILDQLVRG